MAHIIKALNISASSYSRAQKGVYFIDKYREAAPVQERLKDGTFKGGAALLKFLEEWKESTGSSFSSGSLSPFQ
jgi:hypothetical protein